MFEKGYTPWNKGKKWKVKNFNPDSYAHLKKYEFGKGGSFPCQD